MTNLRVPLQPFPLGHKIPPLKTALHQMALHRPVELAAFIRHKASLLNLERQLPTSSTSQSQRFIIEWSCSSIWRTMGGNSLNIPAEQLLGGIWDFYIHYTNFILNNVCQSTVCN